MNSASIASIEISVAAATSTAVGISAQLEPLITAVIAFGISLVTVVGGEFVKYLVAFLKKKREDLNKDDKVQEEKKDQEKKKK